MGETFNFHTPPTNEQYIISWYYVAVLVYQFAEISHGNMNNLNLEISKKGSFKEVFNSLMIQRILTPTFSFFLLLLSR